MPEREISVDETLVLFKGRLFFKQYLPAKRSRFGIKVYMSCEATSGIVLQMAVHVNRNEHDRFAAEDTRRLSMSSRVVIHLCQRFLDLGYLIVCDNWFSSCELAKYLWERQTLLLGTIRPNRGLSPQIRNHCTKVHQTIFMRLGPVLTSKFVDKKASGRKTVFIRLIYSRLHESSVEAKLLKS